MVGPKEFWTYIIFLKMDIVLRAAYTLPKYGEPWIYSLPHPFSPRCMQKMLKSVIRKNCVEGDQARVGFAWELCKKGFLTVKNWSSSQKPVCSILQAWNVYLAYYETYGFHPRSEGFTKRIPALVTVERLAYFKCPISNMSLMVSFRGTRSLLAKVSTYTRRELC